MSPGTIWDSKRHFTFQLESIVDLTVASQTDNGISAAACGLVPCHVVQPKCGPFACGRQASRASATARTGCHAQVVGPAHACGGFNAFLPQTHFDVRCQVDHVLPAPPRLRRGRATASQTPEVHVRRHGSGGQRAHTRESARARATQRKREERRGGVMGLFDTQAWQPPAETKTETKSREDEQSTESHTACARYSPGCNPFPTQRYRLKRTRLAAALRASAHSSRGNAAGLRRRARASPVCRCPGTVRRAARKRCNLRRCTSKFPPPSA